MYFLNPNQIFRDENTISEAKNKPNRINSILDTAEEKISEIKGTEMKIIQNEAQTENTRK